MPTKKRTPPHKLHMWFSFEGKRHHMTLVTTAHNWGGKQPMLRCSTCDFDVPITHTLRYKKMSDGSGVLDVSDICHGCKPLRCFEIPIVNNKLKLRFGRLRGSRGEPVHSHQDSRSKAGQWAQRVMAVAGLHMRIMRRGLRRLQAGAHFLPGESLEVRLQPRRNRAYSIEDGRRY